MISITQNREELETKIHSHNKIKIFAGKHKLVFPNDYDKNIELSLTYDRDAKIYLVNVIMPQPWGKIFRLGEYQKEEIARPEFTRNDDFLRNGYQIQLNALSYAKILPPSQNTQ